MSDKSVGTIKVIFGVNEAYLRDVALNSPEDNVRADASASLKNATTYKTQFEPPYASGDNGIEILMFKHLLGSVVDLNRYDVEDKGWFGARKNTNTPTTQRTGKLSLNDGYQFDEKMAAALVAWQTTNRTKIIEYGQLVMGWGSDANKGNVELDELLRTGETISDTSPEFSLELGKIGKATLAVMHGFRARIGDEYFYSKGFGAPPSVTVPGTAERKAPGAKQDNPPPVPSHLYTAVRAVWQIVYDDSGASTDPNKSPPDQETASQNALKSLMTPKPESNKEPWEEANGDISVFVDTEFTMANPPSFSTAQQVVEYFRAKEIEALNKIYNYYGKADTWGPFVSQDLRDVGLDDEKVLSENKEAKRLYGEVIPFSDPITINESAGKVPYHVFESAEPIKQHSEKNKIKPLIWSISNYLFSADAEAEIYTRVTMDLDVLIDDMASEQANQYFRMPTPRPKDVYRIQFTVSLEKMRLSNSSGAMDIGDAYLKAREAYARAAGMIDAAGEFLEDPGAALEAALDKMGDTIENAAKNAEEAVASKLRYANKNKKKVARNAWKALRRDTEKRRADAKWQKSEALAAKVTRKEIKFPTTTVFEARNFKKRIEAIASQMEEYGEEIKDWQKPTKGTKKKRSGGGNFFPPVLMSKEATALRDCIPAIEDIMRKNGLRLRDKFGEKLSITFLPEKNKAGKITGSSIFTFKYTAAEQDDFIGTGAAASFAGTNTREARSAAFTETVSADGATSREIGAAIAEANEFLEAEAKRTIELKIGRDSWLSVPVQVGEAREPGSDPPRSPKIKHPFNNARTMAYLMQLNEMYDYINKPSDFGASCDEILAPKAIPFIRKFTYPPPGIKPRVKDNYAAAGTSDTRSIDEKISTELESSRLKLMSQISSTVERISEKSKITLKDKGSMLKLERGKVHDINDLLPLGDLCTLKELQQKFLKKFDMKALMCEWAACIPDIPWPLDFDWDFNFNWKWPKLPTFDLYMLYPIVVASLIEMIVRILCSLVNSILESIKFPNCDELFEAAMYGVASLNDAIKEHHSGTVGISLYEARANISPLDSEFLKLIKSRDESEIAAQKSYMQTLVNVGIPQEHLVDNTVSGDSMSGLMEDVSKIMTPTELCTLMKGTASDETLKVVREVIRTSQPSLEAYFLTNDSVATYFSSLGAIVGPEVCAKLEQIPDEVAYKGLCRDEEGNSLRDRLVEGGATADQVRNALAIAAAESSRISNMAQSLAKSNPLASLPPVMDFSNPNSIISDLPPAFLNMVETGVSGLMSIPKSSYLQEIVRYVPSLYDVTTRSLDARDPEFNTYYRVKAKEAMAVLQDFEPYSDMLTDQDLLQNFVAREQLYVRYVYQVHYWTYIPPIQSFGINTPSYWIKGVEDIPADADPSEISRILEKHKAARVGVPVIELAGHAPYLDLKPASSSPSVIRFDSGATYQRLSAAETAKQLPPLQGKIIEYTKPTSALDSRQAVLMTREIKNHAGVRKVEYAATREDVEGTATAKAEFKEALMADVEARLHVLRGYIMRDLEVNQGDRTEQEISPETKALFSKEGEIERENMQKLLEETEFNPTLENFTYKNSEVVMRLPSIDTEDDSYIRYSEIPSTSTPNSIVTVNINDNILTHADFASTHCDILSLPADGVFSDFTVPPGQYMRPEAFYHMVRKSAEADTSRYGIPNLNEQELSQIRELIVGSVYPSAVESFVEEVFNYLSMSPLFESEELAEIENRIRGKSTTDDHGCTTIEKGMIDFDVLIRKAMESVQAEYRKPENSPDKIDFQQKGPFEKGMLTALVNMMIDVLLIEFSLRGGIAFSTFSAEKLLNEKSLETYLTKFITTSIENLSENLPIEAIFKRQIKKMAKMPRYDTALREILLRRLGTIDETPAEDSVVKMIDKVFGTKFQKISISDKMHVTHVPRALPAWRRGVFLGNIKLPMLSDVKKKGRFYMETYVRLSGPGAGEEFGEAEQFSQEFSDFIETLRAEIAAAAQASFEEDAGTYQDIVAAKTTAIENRLEELETIEPLRAALDDDFKVNGKDTELVHIDEIAEFIRRTYHSGFNRELCEIVGAIYSEDPMDACYLAPIETYRYPTRFIKKTRRYLRITNPGTTFNVNARDAGKFSQAIGDEFVLIPKLIEGELWKYYSVPADYCSIRKEYNTEEEYSAVLSSYASPSTPASAESRIGTFKRLNPSKYVDIAMPLEPLQVDAPSEELGGQIVRQMLGAITPQVYQHFPEGFDSPGKRYPLTPEEASTVTGSTIGLTMAKVGMLDPYGEPIAIDDDTPSKWHPLDPEAPWFHAGRLGHPTSNKAFDNLGELTREKFESLINGEDGTLLNAAPGIEGDLSPVGIHEEWTEFVVDYEMFVFNNPGESFHHPDEAPFITDPYHAILVQTLHPELTEHRRATAAEDEEPNPDTNIDDSNLYPFNLNVNVTYSSAFRKEAYRPDIHTHPVYDLRTSAGFSLARPLGHTPLEIEDSHELKSNQFAIPVRVLVTRVDYKMGAQTLDTEIFVNYDVPETVKGSTVRIENPDSTNTRSAIVGLNHKRKKSLQLGLNKLLQDYFAGAEPQLVSDALTTVVTSEEIRDLNGKYAEVLWAKLQEVIQRKTAAGEQIERDTNGDALPGPHLPEAEELVRASLGEDNNRTFSIEPTYQQPEGINDIIGPALTNTKVYSAGAWMDAKESWGWDDAIVSAEKDTELDMAFYGHSRGILVENASAPGGWSELFSLGALNAAGNYPKIKTLVGRYLKNFVDRRTYSGIWGKTSSPWHLWGGFGYIPSVNTHTNAGIDIVGSTGHGAAGGVDARKAYISNSLRWFAPQSHIEIQYDASDIYQYIEQNSQYLGMFEAARENERHLHLVNYGGYTAQSFADDRIAIDLVGDGVSFRQNKAWAADLHNPTGFGAQLGDIPERNFAKFCYIDWNSRYKLSMNPRNHARYVKHFPYDLWFYHDNNVGKSNMSIGSGRDAFLLGKNATHGSSDANLVWRMKPGGVHWEVLPIPDSMAAWEAKNFNTPKFEAAYTGFKLEEKDESLSLSKGATTLGTKPNSTDNLVYGDGYFATSEFDISPARYNLEARGQALSSTAIQEALAQRADSPLVSGAGFNIYARNALISLMLRAQQTEEEFWQTLSAFGDPNREGGEGIFLELNRRLSDEMSKRLEILFRLTQYNIGVRLMYVTPESLKGELEQTAIKTVLDRRHISREERAWKTDYVDIEFPENKYTNAVSFPLMSHEIPLDVRCNFGLIKEEFSKMIPQVTSELIAKEEYKILTEYSFPLDRYATLSSLYSVMALSRKPEMQNLLRSTKSSIARLMLTMENRPAFGEVMKTQDGGAFRIAMMSHMTSDGPEGMTGDMMDKFGDFIGDLAYNAAMSPLWMLRSMAEKLDPAMKDMKKLASSPTCEIEGVKWGNVASSGLGSRLNKGVTGKNEYAPVNTAFPYDLATNLLPYPPFVTKDFFKALHKFANFVVKDKVPKLPRGKTPEDRARIEALQSEIGDRYGSFLGPLGLLSLGIAYMPGEKDMFKKCVFPKPTDTPPADSGTPC